MCIYCWNDMTSLICFKISRGVKSSDSLECYSCHMLDRIWQKGFSRDKEAQGIMLGFNYTKICNKIHLQFREKYFNAFKCNSYFKNFGNILIKFQFLCIFCVQRDSTHQLTVFHGKSLSMSVCFISIFASIDISITLTSNNCKSLLLIKN